MRRQLGFVLPLAVLFGAACGGGDSDSMPVTPGQQGVTCEPQEQTGCEIGEKCASVLIVADDAGTPDDDTESETRCVPEGNGAAGDACTTGEAGDEGYDDCAAGLHCLNDVCTEICANTNNGNTCGGVEAQNCVRFENLFDDTDDIGLCSPACDAVTQDECPGQACFLNLNTAEASCANVPGPALVLRQDDACYGPSAMSCFLNGCPRGYGAILPDRPDTPTINVCAAFCNPVETHTGATESAGGDINGIHCGLAFPMDSDRPTNPDVNEDNAGENYQCRFIQSFYGSTRGVAATFGMCVPTTIWGDCRACDITDLGTFDATCVTNNAFGCITFDTLSNLPMGSGGGALTRAAVYEKMERNALKSGIDIRSLPGWENFGVSTP